MRALQSLDHLVRRRLQQWPQRPPGLGTARSGDAYWLRGRPGDPSADPVPPAQPFLKFPGSNRMRTLPDGLWLNFGGTCHEPFVDIFAIEACGSLQNLLDKRSRFAPSTRSLLAVCPLTWLMAPITPTDETPRWRATGVVAAAPEMPLVLPVRDIRVMYALKQRQYRGFAECQLPQPHEYFVPMEELVAEHAYENPAMQELVSRASARSNFFPEG
ncbi:MAG: hypothetical protein IT555_13480 [Acetobacteraceae bacterium]|nr:hypothetical protein [Acetobacteraceae bacterium]